MSKKNTPQEATAGDYGKMVLALVLGAWAFYTNFLICGGLAGTFLSDPTARLIGTVVFALVLPIMAGLGTAGRRDNFAQRTQHFFMVTGVISLVTGLVVGVVLNRHVIDNMEEDPNWFMGGNSGSSISKKNKAYSRAVGNRLREVTRDIGL
jgi:hypothetical protein